MTENTRSGLQDEALKGYLICFPHLAIPSVHLEITGKTEADNKFAQWAEHCAMVTSSVEFVSTVAVSDQASLSVPIHNCMQSLHSLGFTIH